MPLTMMSEMIWRAAFRAQSTILFCNSIWLSVALVSRCRCAGADDIWRERSETSEGLASLRCYTMPGRLAASGLESDER